MSSTVEVLADAFRECGTPFIVGHPGGETVELMDAARARDMRYILMKQEVAGAMLAATWGEITGSPGVCTSTRGPGAANMVNGVAHAWLDRAPLVALTDQYPRHTYETGLRQVLNLQQMYAPITKWQTTLHARSVGTQVRRAPENRDGPGAGSGPHRRSLGSDPGRSGGTRRRHAPGGRKGRDGAGRRWPPRPARHARPCAAAHHPCGVGCVVERSIGPTDGLRRAVGAPPC